MLSVHSPITHSSSCQSVALEAVISKEIPWAAKPAIFPREKGDTRMRRSLVAKVETAGH